MPPTREGFPPDHSHSIINGAVMALICRLFFNIDFRNTLLYTLPEKFLLLLVVASLCQTCIGWSQVTESQASGAPPAPSPASP